MNGSGYAGAIWGLAGVLFLLGYAVFRLLIVAMDAFTYAFEWRHWSLLIVNTVFMAYAEGYRGFQMRYSPRVAARARFLMQVKSSVTILFAPLFCMGYFCATRRILTTTYILTITIILLIYLFQQLSQPWRGILDAGVIVGLSWGMVSIILYGKKALFDSSFEFSPEVPTRHQ